MARRLPTHEAHALVNAARHSFRDAVGISAIAGAAIVIILAVATIVTLRGAPTHVEGDVHPGNNPTGPDRPASLIPGTH